MVTEAMGPGNDENFFMPELSFRRHPPGGAGMEQTDEFMRGRVMNSFTAG